MLCGVRLPTPRLRPHALLRANTAPGPFRQRHARDVAQPSEHGR